MGEIICQEVDIITGCGKRIVLKNLSLALEAGSCTRNHENVYVVQKKQP